MNGNKFNATVLRQGRRVAVELDPATGQVVERG